MGKDNVIRLIAKGVLLFFVLIFLIYPIALVFASAINPAVLEKAFSIIISRQNLLYSSFLQAAVSTVFSVIIGLPAAYILARRQFRGKKVVRAVSLIPFVFPSVLVVLSFVIIFGNNGWINSALRILGIGGPVQFLYGFWGVILAHVFYNFPLVTRFVADAWSGLDSSMEEAAKSLGARKIGLFFKITLPQLVPSILASATLVFIYCFMSFAIVLSLGGLQVSTFEVEIFQQISRNLDIGTGAVLALFQFLLLTILASTYLFFTRSPIQKRSASLPPRPFKLGTVRGKIELAFLCIILLFILLPVLSLVIFSFFDTKTWAFSLRAFEKIFLSGSSLSGATAISAIFYSLLLALIGSVIATVMGLFAALRQTKIPFIGLLASATIAISVITLGFGFLLGFGSGNLIIIAIGHSVLAFPFAYRAISNSLAKIDSDSIDAAATLGAGQIETFKRVQFPRIRQSLLVSLAFCFAVSLGELGLVLLLYDGIYPTMPVYIYRLISVFDIGAATAMGLILVGVSFLCFYVIEHFSADASVF